MPWVQARATVRSMVPSPPRLTARSTAASSDELGPGVPVAHGTAGHRRTVFGGTGVPHLDGVVSAFVQPRGTLAGDGGGLGSFGVHDEGDRGHGRLPVRGLGHGPVEGGRRCVGVGRRRGVRHGMEKELGIAGRAQQR